MDLGDLGKFRFLDDASLGFSVYKVEQDGTLGKKLFWLNSKGEAMLFGWLKAKLDNKEDVMGSKK